MEQNFWARICIMLSKIEREAKLFERFGISKLLYSHITSVDASMRGKGLGSRLAATLMEVGRAKGFPAMVDEVRPSAVLRRLQGRSRTTDIYTRRTTHYGSSYGHQTVIINA
ncbi:GM16970 [Drosophila sechellia]|uniref:GM16970 n=1 Tax=Drosophila sechellia TaxID=7238 RepID=B4I622_DROSE|nr:GM16970 [Drosophila sechellia]